MPGAPLSNFGLLKQLYESQWKGRLWDTDPTAAEDHAPKTPHFTVTLKCEGANLRLDDRRDDILGLLEFFGEGRNKKEAQNMAAAKALQHFTDAGYYDPTDPEKYKKKDKGIVSRQPCAYLMQPHVPSNVSFRLAVPFTEIQSEECPQRPLQSLGLFRHCCW
jgi:hypothetical protein